MFSFMKPRTKFGKWLDSHSIDQQDFAKEAKCSRNTISKAANDKSYIPSPTIMKKILSTVRKVDKDKQMDDFWSM